MFNLYFVFGSIAVAYVIGCILLIKNTATAAGNGGVPERADPAIQALEQGTPVAGATLRRPQLRKPAAHWTADRFGR